MAAGARPTSAQAAAAKPGDWTLTGAGEKGTCTGKLHVDAAGPSP